MTGTPQSLPETPERVRDALSDLLDSMHLAGMVLFRAAFREPWSVMTPDAGELKRLLPFRTEHIIPFHVVASGGCWLELGEAQPAWLGAGDAVLLPYGDRHGMRGRDAAPAVPVGSLLPASPWSEIQVVTHGGMGAETSIICGFLQCDDLLFRPILKHLPLLMHVRPNAGPNGGDGDAWLQSTIARTAAEASRPMPGSRSMLPRLTELMFVEILRQHMRSLAPGEVGWLAAYNDPAAGAALRALHAEPQQPWTVEALARRAGVSRTVLAERFRHFLGQPPMQYLAQWRLRLAAQTLKATELPVKRVAADAGYESEAAFSRAFRRQYGLPPADWRRGARPGDAA